jgi:small ligand-binding sensory domain FIST
LEILVEEGQVVSFVLRDANEALRDMNSMMTDLEKVYHDHPPRFGLYFNCCGRGRSLYGKTGVDLSVIKKYPGEIPLMGLFTNAEIAPIRGMTQFHTYSGVLCLIGE